MEGIKHDIVATDERVYGKKCPFVEIGIANRFPIGNGISLHKKICIHSAIFLYRILLLRSRGALIEAGIKYQKDNATPH